MNIKQKMEIIVKGMVKGMKLKPQSFILVFISLFNCDIQPSANYTFMGRKLPKTTDD